MNEESFIVNKWSIEEFFEKNRKYVIPEYQRKYSWENEQIEALISDFLEAFNDYKNGINSSYFLGSIVEIKKEKEHIATIVDGQQRITTLMILSLVLYRNFSDINEKNKDPFIIKSSKLKSYIWIDDEQEISRLSINVPEYMEKYNEILNLTSFENLSENVSDKEFLKNYKNAAITIYERLKSIKSDLKKDFDKFINFIYQNANIVEIECNNEAFAIKLFQILNDRGMDLKISDLLKVELKRKIEQEYNEMKRQKSKEKIKNEILLKAKEEKEKAFESKWASIEEDINEIDLSFDDLLVIYEYYKLQSNPRISVWDNIKKIVKDEKNALDIVNEIYEILNILSNDVYSDKLNKVICGLNYIRWERYILTIIVTIKKDKKYQHFEDAEEREKNERSEERVLKAIRRYYYLNWIAGKTANTIKETSFDLIKELSKGSDASKIEEMLNKKIEETNITPKLISDILRGNIRNERYLKPLLLMVEYEILEGEEANFIEINRTLHLEHILPEEYAKEKDWKKDWNKEDANKILNTIGNFTLLNMKKNISAHNYKFSVKIPIYKGEVKNKDLQGITKLQITQKIINDYEANTYNKRWNMDAVTDRRIFLLGKIQDILDIKILNKEEEKRYGKK